MNDLIVQVSKGYRTVIPSRTFIGNDGENLQTKIIFTFLDEFIDGIARLEVLIDDEKSYLPLTKDKKSYFLPIKNVMTKEGSIELQLVITEPENEEGIPLYKSDKFKLYCKASINAVDEAPDGYDLWIDTANAILIEMDNLNIDANKQGHTTDITLTRKDGSKKIVKIEDGIGLNFNWSGTSLGVKREDETTFDYVNLKGENGQNGQNGQDGVGLNFNWSGTSLGVKREDETTYQYVNLKGENGQNGQNGQDGVGVPVGGLTGQILKKASNDNYNTVWADIPSGSLVVTYNSSTGTSHSPSQIKQALDSDVDVYLQLSTSTGTSYIPVLYSSQTEAIASYIEGNSTTTPASISLTTYRINSTNQLTFSSFYLVSTTDLSNSLGNYLSKTNTTSYTPSGDYNPATKKYVDDLVASIYTAIDLIHPVGSLYISVDSTSPATLFGGTWQQITSDAYLKIVTSNGGDLGGTSSSHVIPLDSIPAHTHGLKYGYGSGSNNTYTPLTTNKSLTNTYTESPVLSAGGGQAYYPYYLGVYVWKRTA